MTEPEIIALSAEAVELITALRLRAQKAEALAAESIEAIKAAFGVLDMAEVGYAATLMGRVQMLVNWRNSLKYGFEETAKSLRAAESERDQARAEREESRKFAADKGHEIVDLKNSLSTARTALTAIDSIIAEGSTGPNGPFAMTSRILNRIELALAALTSETPQPSEQAGALSAETAMEPRKDK